MTDAPPPPRPDESDDVSHAEQHPAPAPDHWAPVADTLRSGRFRRVGNRIRGSRVALAVIGVVVAAGLVLGGFALADGGHGRDRDGRGAAGQRGGQDRNGDGNNAGNNGGSNGGSNNGNGQGGDRGDRMGRAGDRNGVNGNAGNGANGNAGNGDNGNGANGAGNGAEQHVLGTLSAVSSTSITLRTSGGTPSYPVTASTPVTRNGSAASVADLVVGEAVVVHVTTGAAGSAPAVERIVAG